MNRLLFAINVGWYYDLHWKSRVHSSMTSSMETHLCMSKPTDANEENMHEMSLTRSSKGLFDNLRTLTQAIFIYRKVKPTIIHSVTIKPNLMFGLIALLTKTPILITIPGLGSMFSQTTLLSRSVATVVMFFYRIVGLNTKAVFIFENSQDKQLFLDKSICKASDAVTVPGSGVNLAEYQASPITTEKQPLKLLFAARLLEGKGLRELLETVKELKAEGEDIELNVAGIIDDDSNESIPLHEIETWHRDGHIRWLGQVNEGMCQVIASNDAVVLPTRYGEGLPRILIEANACRRAVITTDIGGCREFIQNGRNGILVPVCDASALKKAIRRLLDREYCAELGAWGRERVEEAFTDKHVVDSYTKIYNRHLTDLSE
ncbi:glycosyltransferase family 4 protein [Thaumasiovibrio sp. DFM-14]|uniref:glycosyltransferase family 4 protein n=1 Tax=Thaumasiovibrio sp. DFM-14 TaxID=3384792 RepID=UPI0039A13108